MSASTSAGENFCARNAPCLALQLRFLEVLNLWATMIWSEMNGTVAAHVSEENGFAWQAVAGYRGAVFLGCRR